jgi:hypothetical protein
MYFRVPDFPTKTMRVWFSFRLEWVRFYCFEALGGELGSREALTPPNLAILLLRHHKEALRGEARRCEALRKRLINANTGVILIHFSNTLTILNLSTFDLANISDFRYAVIGHCAV